MADSSRSPGQRPDASHLRERLAALADARTDDHTRALQARVVLESMQHATALVDIDGTLLDVNGRTIEATKVDRSRILGRLLWETPWWIRNPLARNALRRLVEQARAGAVARDVVSYLPRTGSLGAIPVEVTISPVFDPHGHVVFLVAEGENVADRRAAEAIIEAKSRALAESEARFRALAENTSDLVCLHNPDGTYQYLSPSLRKLLGYEPSELIGTHPEDRVHPDDRQRVEDRYHAPIAGDISAAEFTFRMRRRGGAYLWFESVITPILGAGGEIVQLQSSSRDVTERKRTEDELVRLAFHDELTGLPNRALLLDRIGQALAVTRRTRQSVAVLFIDLDGFKAVNDTIGHYAGDATLVAVAERLTGMVRPGDTLARLGGDEFVMLCTGVDGAGGASVVATRVLHALNQAFTVYGRTIDLSASIGIAVSSGLDDPLRLVEDADTAMYEAKRSGRNRYTVFDPEERSSTLNRLATEFALRRAVDRGELRLHYQPELDLTTREITGFEALVRWQRDDGTLIPPGEFIPLAEETGLIV
ncbi:MAG TPA: diguanylate cyclase, partial [Acidimicrobiales bacterium]|nr:diguanylate cyclase [Acidimicrobiales bacterium]